MILISSQLFEAYIKCPTKCFLRSQGETGSGNPYATWIHTRNARYVSEGIRLLGEESSVTKCATGSINREDLRSATWELATECTMRTRNLECTFHAVERFSNDTAGKSVQFIPTRLIVTNKLTRDDKLLLAFDAAVLSESLGREVYRGKIIHGDNHFARSVQTTQSLGEVRRILPKITVLLTSETPPDLVLNKHCAECEFQKRCRQKATEEDDLSLLAGISADERSRNRSKGIFSVKQLSYTFRPRRAPKRAKNPGRPRYSALHALAIRENTVFVHGSPTLPNFKTKVYLDIEGVPDSDSYYLIGSLIVSKDQEIFRSFWSNCIAEESEAFSQFVDEISRLDDFQVLHFGDYEITALRRMRHQLSDRLQSRIDTILERCTNILSVIHPHIYFPTYSNSLKDIGRFLGFQRTYVDASGLDSIIWRTTWNESHAEEIKARLLQYNRDDCLELKHITEFLIQAINQPKCAQTSPLQEPFKVASTEGLAITSPRQRAFGHRTYASEDFEKIAKCAYFDYQRDKILARAHPQLKATVKKRQRRTIKTNKTCLLESKRCPECGSKRIDQGNQQSHVEIDLKFFKGGAKKWVTRTVSWKYQCSKCKHEFSSEDRAPNPQRYGHGLVSWCVYSSVACGASMLGTAASVGDVFGVTLPNCQAYRWKEHMATFYEPLYAEILQSILSGPVIHIDETTVKLRKQNGYVWVISSLDKVYYFYKPSREGSFLHELLEGFSGVLVSDFFTAYDSLKCQQQKCLVHLLRDIDDDLMKNPLDSEFTTIAREFGVLLRAIVETVDVRGLKSRYLRKYTRATRRFLKSVASTDMKSPLAERYKKRFQKTGEKMFTFLDHDGVPWNNNNAEHAIKRFARYRRDADGRFTEHTLEDYLTLASVFETCELNNVNVLRFLLSKEATLKGLLGMAKR